MRYYLQKCTQQNNTEKVLKGIPSIFLTKFLDISKTFPGQNLKVLGQNTETLLLEYNKKDNLDLVN